MSRPQLNRSDRGTDHGADDTDCTVLHIDMDAFYAAVELLSRPHLRGQPVVVGGGGNRGVVLTATYEAREFGVHSGMPMARARRMCPQAVVIAPDHRHYSRVSAGVMEIFRTITDEMEPLALDEAFLDVSGATRRLGSPRQIGELIRSRIHDEQGITASVGAATTKFVAKLASTRAKPDGLLVVPASEVVAFLHPMKVGSLWGVGERTEEQLHRLGLRTVADIAGAPGDHVGACARHGPWATPLRLSWGRDPRRVQTAESERSMVQRRPSRRMSTIWMWSGRRYCGCRRRSLSGFVAPD